MTFNPQLHLQVNRIKLLNLKEIFKALLWAPKKLLKMFGFYPPVLEGVNS